MEEDNMQHTGCYEHVYLSKNNSTDVRQTMYSRATRKCHCTSSHHQPWLQAPVSRASWAVDKHHSRTHQTASQAQLSLGVDASPAIITSSYCVKAVQCHMCINSTNALQYTQQLYNQAVLVGCQTQTGHAVLTTQATILSNVMARQCGMSSKCNKYLINIYIPINILSSPPMLWLWKVPLLCTR